MTQTEINELKMKHNIVTDNSYGFCVARVYSGDAVVEEVISMDDDEAVLQIVNSKNKDKREEI